MNNEKTFNAIRYLLIQIRLKGATGSPVRPIAIR